MDENLEPSSEANADPETATDVESGGTDTGAASAPAAEGQDGGEQAPLDSGSAGDSAGEVPQADALPADASPADAVPGGPGAADSRSALGDAVAGDAADPVTSAPDMLQSAAEMIDAGGPVVIILLVMSVIALAIILVKLWQFAGAGLGDRRPVERVLTEAREGNLAAAAEAAEGGRGPAMRALSAALTHGADQNRAREAAWLAANEELESARTWLRPLEVIAALAPLLGLFGTVLGMIAAFAELEAAGSRVDPSILSGGIWEALLTTAVGLAVAIPAVAAFNWFERRIERAESLAERATSALFTAIVPANAPSIANEPDAPAPAPVAPEGRLHAVAQG
ncbi:MAG TPA: MotA/TolQ/ExbB proton channel family protein [Paracoccaceae bacterium]|nr:MotA/TolQ/ExbB proton channel family protein [Paracoccaceae bacterium]